ncbi:MAG: hypothetical protein Q9163_002229 [Psora crenata]
MTHFATPPAMTNPAAPKYPQPRSILKASRFWSATAHETPLLTQPTPLPGRKRNPGSKLVLDREGAEGPGEVFSSGLQTIIRMGKRDMHELTKSAVEMELGVGGLGGCEFSRGRANDNEEAPLSEHVQVQDGRGVGGILGNRFDVNHCQVDVKEEEEGAQAADRRV